MADSPDETIPARGLVRTPEIPSLTTLRGILSLWVVVGHYWIPMVALLPGIRFLEPVAERGQMAVPAFFVLSGWVLSYNYAESFSKLSLGGISRFLGLRLARLYPVHLATLAVVLFLFLAAPLLGKAPESPDKYGFLDFILNLGLMQSWAPWPDLSWNYPSWSISAEWFAYLLFPFATFAFHRTVNKTWRAWLVALVGLLAATEQTFLFPDVPFQALLLVVSTFAIGMAIHWSNRLGPAGKPMTALPEIAVLLAIASCYLPSPRPTFLVLCIAPAVAIWSLSRLGNGCSRFWNWAPLALLGEVSYSLYMTHAVTAKILLPLLPPARWAGSGLLWRIPVAVCYIVAVGAGTWICYRFVERPFRRRLRALFK